MKIIVSLTSYPARIYNLHRVIKTLLIQNKKADKIILWLADSQFPQKEKELPQELLNLMQYGLEIRWCEDLKPHKKYFYAMQEFPDDIVITVDDDVYYTPRLIELLYESYLKYPYAVSCMRANQIIINAGGDTDYKKWEPNYRKCLDEPVMDLLPVGVGGVLYPPNSIPKEGFNEELIQELCLFQDDLWLKAMEVINNVPTVLVGSKEIVLDFIEEEQCEGLSNTVNVEGNNIAIRNIMNYLDRISGKTNYFYERIIETDNNTEGVEKRKKLERIEREKLLLSRMNGKKILVYGAGLGANMTLACLLAYSRELKPDAFIVADKNKNPKELLGIPVVEIDELKAECSDCFVIVSTAEKLHKEIANYLYKHGFNNIAFIQDKVMGKIIRGNREINEAHEFFMSSLRKYDD